MDASSQGQQPRYTGLVCAADARNLCGRSHRMSYRFLHGSANEWKPTLGTILNE